MSPRKILLFLLLCSCIFGLSFLTKKNAAAPFHSLAERQLFEEQFRDPIDSNEFFLTSFRCQGCHGFDSTGFASVDDNGIDVNLYDDWAATMMANSAIDPFWRAKVSHEILVNPSHSAELQTKCTSCHAPMGHYTAIYHGATSYTIADLENDSLGLNGVACNSCHSIGTQNLGTVFSGNIPYDTSGVEYGPFQNPLAGPMQLYVGLTPIYSTHMDKGAVCSSCHTLLINSVDLSGNYTGSTFVEQATHHEWLNSALSADNVTCQKCHMPPITDSVVIANQIVSLPPRAPFNQHQFAGANYFMVNLIKENKTALGISTPDHNFDSTLLATYKMLTEKTLNLQLQLDSITSDTVFLKLQVTNKAGHKFPSGYPSRRAVVQLLMIDQNMDTVFQSGTFTSAFEVKNIDAIMEPHHDVINQPDEILIYEMVMGDVNGNVTTVLERADQFLKDNRMPPEGFVTTHPSYDTMQIVGEALNDPNFNKNGLTEGSGKDFVYYHVPLNGFNGYVSAYASVFYQAVPPRWLEEMFAFNSDPINTFRDMYDAADRTPFLTEADTILNIPVSAEQFTSAGKGISLLQTLTPGNVIIENKSAMMIYSASITDLEGKGKVNISLHSSSTSIPMSLPERNGLYIIDVITENGHFIFKAVRMKP